MLKVDDLHLEALVQCLDVFDTSHLGLQSSEFLLRQVLSYARLHDDDVAELALASASHQVATDVPLDLGSRSDVLHVLEPLPGEHTPRSSLQSQHRLLDLPVSPSLHPSSGPGLNLSGSALFANGLSSLSREVTTSASLQTHDSPANLAVTRRDDEAPNCFLDHQTGVALLVGTKLLQVGHLSGAKENLGLAEFELVLVLYIRRKGKSLSV